MTIVDYLNEINKDKRYRVVEELKVDIWKKDKKITKVLFETDNIEEADEKIIKLGGYCKTNLRENRYYLYFDKNTLVRKYKIIKLEV